MNTRRAESLIRRALSEGGSGTLFQAEPVGGAAPNKATSGGTLFQAEPGGTPTDVKGKMTSPGTLLPADDGHPASPAYKEWQNGIGSLGKLKAAQDQYDSTPAGRRDAAQRAGGWGGGSPSYSGSNGAGSSPSTAGAARPPSLPYDGTKFPSAPRGGGRSNVGSMSRSEHVEVRGGGGSTAPAGGGRGASRITERRTATIVMRPLDEGDPYVTQPGNTPTAPGSPYATQPGNTPYNGGGGGTPPTAPAAPAAAAAGVGSGASRGGTLLKAEPSGGSYGGGGPTAPRPGNTGSTGGGGGGVGGVLSSVGSAVMSTAGRAVGQAIQGNGKVDYSGMARNVGGYAAGTAVNGLAKSAMGAMGGSSR